MRHIKKTGTPAEAKGRSATKDFVDSCWSDAHKQYENLAYERSRLGEIGKALIEDQTDVQGDSYCCYCMRKLFLESDGCDHTANVTYEHIIPHKISLSDWERDKDKYLQFANLRGNYVLVCIEAKLSEVQKRTKMTGLPYPHFISYHNLVASCNGTVFEGKAMENGRCCNNNRQERFVMPVFLSADWASGISYTKKGDLDYDDSRYDSSWFDEDHLNLSSTWIKLVRRTWYKVSKSGYTDQDVEHAIHDKELRQNIIDDIDNNNEISSWAESDQAWKLFSEYSWFYSYYSTVR